MPATRQEERFLGLTIGSTFASADGMSNGDSAPPRRVAALVCIAQAVIILAGCRSGVIDPTVIADAQLAARVKTALLNDSEIGEFRIEVRVTRGVASLSGRVRSSVQAARAVTLARGVSGIVDVRLDLGIGLEPSPPGSEAAGVADPFSQEGAEFDPGPRTLAIGAAFSWSSPTGGALKQRFSFSPLFRLGSPQGFGPAVAFDWFRADVESAGGLETLARVHVRPLMGGIGYTWRSNRFSVAPSLVAGVAFNSLTITDTGPATGLPVEIGNSLAWRAGVSAWYDISRRFAINVSTGYLFTDFHLTVLQGNQLVTRDADGDTTLLHAGIAYKLF